MQITSFFGTQIFFTRMACRPRETEIPSNGVCLVYLESGIAALDETRSKSRLKLLMPGVSLSMSFRQTMYLRAKDISFRQNFFQTAIFPNSRRALTNLLVEFSLRLFVFVVVHVEEVRLDSPV